MQKICCVNDMPGVGKIALSAMIPILSAKGIDVASLPTALVSNTLDFGKFDILDTTDYMEKTVDIWNELGFRFDCISTGFMVNPRQIDIVEKLINNQAKENLLVVVD
ncbi:MAG: phosphomethylpyrimidine kinase, partial [Oscillospiraceae bacterium]|nr:phosphomethylpyrimidine kinase [Oscillospiraceae bacterium]